VCLSVINNESFRGIEPSGRFYLSFPSIQTVCLGKTDGLLPSNKRSFTLKHTM